MRGVTRNMARGSEASGVGPTRYAAKAGHFVTRHCKFIVLNNGGDAAGPREPAVCAWLGPPIAGPLTGRALPWPSRRAFLHQIEGG
jgi:hypothetical protein